MSAESIKVAVRVRPFNSKELKSKSKLVVSMNGGETIVTNPETNETRKFTFDHSYWSHDGFTTNDSGKLEATSTKYISQETVFKDLGEAVIENSFQGFNSTIFAYGQTGSGKTFSIMGDNENNGIVPMLCNAVFERVEVIKSEVPDSEFHIRISMLEVYKNKVRDLLVAKGPKSGLLVREDVKKNTFYVPGLGNKDKKR